MAFKSVNVDIDLYGNRVIQWTMDGNTPVSSFSVDWSRSSTNDAWKELIDQITDSCMVIDTRKLNFDKTNELYYRVRALDEKGNVAETSCVAMAGTSMKFRDASIISGLTKAMKTEIDVSGRDGYLLKKIEWGTPCPRCSDFGTNESLDPHCPICLGTGKRSGYYEALPLKILPNVESRTVRTLQTTSDTYINSATCIAEPCINRGDIWVGELQNDRYFIDNVNVTSEYKGIPLVYNLIMKRIPMSDVVYSDKMTQKITGQTAQDYIEESYVDYVV